MGLETRNGRGTYLYRKVREGEKVRSVYVASGALAVALDGVDEGRRMARKARGRTVADPGASALAASVEAYCEAVGDAVRAHLERLGYRRHRRGEWRKARMKAGKTERTRELTAGKDRASLLLEAAGRGELPIPKGKVVWGFMANNVIEVAVNHLCRAAGDPDTPTGQSIAGAQRLDLAMMRSALEGPDPTPLERLMVERVVVCYAALHAVETSAHGIPTNRDAAGARQVDRLQRRYLEAARSLAQIKRMRLPASPVFVGGQHVHVEGG